jgi:hypothetical protein
MNIADIDNAWQHASKITFRTVGSRLIMEGSLG